MAYLVPKGRGFFKRGKDGYSIVRIKIIKIDDERHLVEHPDDDEAVLVGGGELLVRLVPCHHLYTS
jgi:hypothetical protein